MNTTALQQAAEEARRYFAKGKRDDGTRFWKTVDGAPEWVTDLCRSAHEEGHVPPDDYRYAAIVEALDAFAENEDPDDVQPESDIYTADLKRWLMSAGGREDYVDRAMNEEGIVDPAQGLVALLSAGQYLELREVYDAVRGALDARVEETGTEEVEEDETELCAYCGAELLVWVGKVPDEDDEEQWEALAAQHGPGCEWVETRAHRRG